MIRPYLPSNDVGHEAVEAMPKQNGFKTPQQEISARLGEYQSVDGDTVF